MSKDMNRQCEMQEIDTYFDFMRNRQVRKYLRPFIHEKHAKTDAYLYLECYIKCEEFLDKKVDLEIDKKFYEELKDVCPYRYEIKLQNNYKKYQENNITKEEIRSFVTELMNGCSSYFINSIEKEDFCNHYKIIID